MDLRQAALLVPASAAGALLAVRGATVLAGPGATAFAVLAGTGLAGVAAVLVAARRATRGALPALPPAAEALLRGTATPLGDAALAFDAAGRLVWANASAVALSGYAAEALLGRTREALGGELAILLRGLERGPSCGRVTLRSPAGEITVEAAAVRVPGPTPIDVAVLRLAAAPRAGGAAERAADVMAVEDADLVAEARDVPARPPPIPAPPGADRQAAARERAADALAGGEAAALRGEVGGPLERASAAAAMLRLLLPGGAPAAEPLARLERELRRAHEALSALTAPLPPPSPRVVEVDVVLGEALAAARLPAAIRVDRQESGARAFADAAQLQQALRHLVRIAADAMPAGGVLAVRSTRRGAAVEIDLADTGAARAAPAGIELALARRLVGAQGGRLERAAMAGRGALSRVSLPPAPVARAERSAVL